MLSVATLHGGSATESGQLRLVVRADSRTGRLVRSVAAPPKVAKPARHVESRGAPSPESNSEPAPAPPGTIHEIVDQIAARHDVEPNLVHSVIRVESNYNPHAISPKGALGVMQLIPATARRFGVENAFNPVQNIEGGVKYLKYLLDYFSGNHALALAAYNAGEGAVVRYGGIPPFRETQDYVVRVWKHWGEANRRFPRSQTGAAVQPETRRETGAPGEYNRIEESIDEDGNLIYISR